MQSADVSQYRVLVAGREGGVAARIGALISNAGEDVERSESLEFFPKVTQAPGAIVLDEEILDLASIEMLRENLRGQPSWSDLPVIVAASGERFSDESMRLLNTLGQNANLTVLDGRFGPHSALSAVKTALRDRRRQYEIRSHVLDRQRSEQKLQETAKLESLGVLAGGIAHDFNNLLVGVMGNASLALDSLSANDPKRPLLDNIVRASECAADLARQLLAYSGRSHFTIQLVNLSQLVREIVSLMNTTLWGAFELRLELAEVPDIDADETQIRQLVMNLVINAAEAIGEKAGAVTVRTGLRQTGADQCVSLEVIDTGSGMDEATRSKIFDPFFTTKFSGRGLGLSAALGIVRAHNGSIQVESEPARGSAFTILFPVAQKRKEAARQTFESGEDLRGTGTILVVDDEEIVRATARNSLVSYGYTVLEAATGRESIQRVREHDTIALVLLDLTMPVMSGAETFRRLRELRSGLPVILSSGLAEAEAEQRFRGQGLAGFLQKPYTSVALASKIKSVMLGTRPIHAGHSVQL